MTAQSVLAVACFGANEGAWGGNYDSSGDTFIRYGWKGEVDLAFASPDPDATIIHPAQIRSPVGTDGVGWGTYRGEGISASCPDNAANWRIYIDGYSFGDYYCNANYGTVANGAQNQFFRIEYTMCPGDGFQKWVLYWNSVWKTCKTINVSHGATIAGGESEFTFETQNIAVSYSALRWRNGSGSWLLLPDVVQCQDVGYFVDVGWVAAWDIEVPGP